ncbi:hypothetical protein LPJ61_004285 [Coemansia biformis]|uniref:molybdopterin adenylyltransferase n=1 Tax=Coemansia biformis TaxID=1286918 RepID=A0A9W8CXS1_9FUNG|nr:hypothetical protein LPJ61_004285 [Coemansia biformis]
MPVPVGILTVSDACSRGLAADTSGPALERLLIDKGGGHWAVVARLVVPDDKQLIAAAVREWCQPLGAAPGGAAGCRLVIIAGGTGISPGDVTVEAIEPLFSKRLWALATAMVIGSLTITPFAALSQVAAGVVGAAVVLAVPGSRKGSVENVQQILSVLPHAVDTAGAQDGTRGLHTSSGTPASKEAPAPVPAPAPGAKCGCARADEAGDGDASAGVPTAHGLSDKLGDSVVRRARKSPYPMTPVSEALDMVLSSVGVGPTASISLGELRPGQVLADDVVALENVPGYRASVMDGYAVVAADGPGVYPVRAAATAGSGEHAEMQPGEVVRVATGAPLPPGADAVVMVEDTELVSSTAQGDEESRVRLLASGQVVAGQHIRPIGYDQQKGAVVLPKYTAITAVGGEIGALATSGNITFAVKSPPTIAVMSTGDEVVDTLAEPFAKYLPFGAIRDSNRPALLAALRALGCPTVDLGVVKDDPDVLASTIRTALETCRGVITTGGVSMGERDWLKSVVEQRLGGKIHFGRVAMKPSKPTTFATVSAGGSQANSEGFVFALPGNPASALVAFHMFVAPAIRKIAGHLLGVDSSDPTRVLGVLRPSVTAVFDSEDIVLDRVRPEYVRGILAWDHTASRWAVRIMDRRQQSSRMANMQSANALISLPVGTDEKPAVLRNELVTAIVIAAVHF